MIVGKYNFNRLNNFDQVCLCCILRNKAKSINMVSPVPYTQNMWCYKDGGFELNDAGKKFLSFCKKADKKLLGTSELQYTKTFDAVVDEAKKCGKSGMIEKYLYYTDMNFEDAKACGDVVKQDDLWKLAPSASNTLLIKSTMEISFNDFMKEHGLDISEYAGEHFIKNDNSREL